MILMARDRGTAELTDRLRGRTVLLWTCETCARLCGLGGRSRAEDLASRLSADGVDVAGIVSSSACCRMRKAEALAGEAPSHDLVLALCCDMGARNASAATGSEVLNPVVTFGPGYLDSDGTPRLASVVCGNVVMDVPLEEAADGSGCLTGPY